MNKGETIKNVARYTGANYPATFLGNFLSSRHRFVVLCPLYLFQELQPVAHKNDVTSLPLMIISVSGFFVTIVMIVSTRRNVRRYTTVRLYCYIHLQFDIKGRYIFTQVTPLANRFSNNVLPSGKCEITGM